jgi:hypothetical protein
MEIAERQAAFDRIAIPSQSIQNTHGGLASIAASAGAKRVGALLSAGLVVILTHKNHHF